jgi:cold shock CspA family protein
VTLKEASYCFIIRDGTNDRVFAHISRVESAVWDTLALGSRVAFQIGFSFRGPQALNVAVM